MLEFGMPTLIENRTLEDKYEKRAIESMLKSNVFVLTWDIGHSKATGEMDVPFILRNKDKLRHFHIHDGTESPPHNHLALGDGEINLPERLMAAKSTNARCVLETKTVEALKKSVRWLQRERYLDGRKECFKVDLETGK